MPFNFQMDPIGTSPVLQGISGFFTRLVTPDVLVREEALSRLRGDLSRDIQTIDWNITTPLEVESHIFNTIEIGMTKIFRLGSFGIYLYNMDSGKLFARTRTGMTAGPGIYGEYTEGRVPRRDDKEDLLQKISGKPPKPLNSLFERMYTFATGRCLLIADRQRLGLPNYASDVEYYGRKGISPEVLKEIAYYFPNQPQLNLDGYLELIIFLATDWAHNRKMFRGLPAEPPENMRQIGAFLSDATYLLKEARDSYQRFESEKKNSESQFHKISRISESSKLPTGVVWEPLPEIGSKYAINARTLPNGETAFYLLSVTAKEYASNVSALLLGDKMDLALSFSQNLAEVMQHWNAAHNFPRNVRLFLGIIDEEARKLRFYTTGDFSYENILIVPRKGPSGFLYEIPRETVWEENPRQGEYITQLNPGDTILVYGSGVPGTVSSPQMNVEAFGYNQMKSVVESLSERTPQSLTQRVAEALRNHAGGMPQSVPKAALAVGVPEEIYRKTWRIINAEKMETEKTDYAVQLQRLAREISYTSPDPQLGHQVVNAVMETMDRAISGELPAVAVVESIDKSYARIKKAVRARGTTIASVQQLLRNLIFLRLRVAIEELLSLSDLRSCACQVLSAGECNDLLGQIENLSSELAQIFQEGILQGRSRDELFNVLSTALQEKVKNIQEGLRVFMEGRPFSQPEAVVEDERGRSKAPEIVENIRSKLEQLLQVELPTKFEMEYVKASNLFAAASHHPKKTILDILDENGEAIKSLLDRIFHIEIKDEIFAQMMRLGYTQPLAPADFASFGEKQNLIWHALVHCGYLDREGNIQPEFRDDLTRIDPTPSLSRQERNEILDILNEHCMAVLDMKTAFGESIINNIVYGVRSENSYIKCKIGKTEEPIVCDDGETIPRGTDRVIIDIYNEVPLTGVRITDAAKLEVIERPDGVRGRGTGMMRALTSRDSTLEEGVTPDGKSKYYRIRLIKYKDPTFRQISDEERMQITLGSLAGLDDLIKQDP